MVYEELIKNPPGYFHEIFDHFNLKWTVKVQKYINNPQLKENPGSTQHLELLKIRLINGREMNLDEIEQVRDFVEPFNLPFIIRNQIGH